MKQGTSEIIEAIFEEISGDAMTGGIDKGGN